MHPATLLRSSLRILAVLSLFLMLPSVRGQSAASLLEKDRLKAIDRERAGRWAGACRVWADMGRKARSTSVIREAYRRSPRRLPLAARQSDTVYRATTSR